MNSAPFDTTYTQLPEIFFQKQQPTPVAQPRLVIWNQALAKELGHFANANPEWLAQTMSGNQIPVGSAPIAQAYAGHQFGHLAMLGDGRAILLGEILTPTHQRYDLQLKGAGRTPFSRRGDGRAALAPMLREYLMGEAMHALGIPTTRGLAVVTTGETVYRETPLAGAILTRVAASHLRIGTFEYAALHEDPSLLRALADYTIQRHYPECAHTDYVTFLASVIDRQAYLVAQWLLVGFVHGVMNTDNVALSGETLDYGPCAFIDRYDRGSVFSSIDHDGRYAYGQQPEIMQWNLARFAETLIPLLHPDTAKALEMATDQVTQFHSVFERYFQEGMRRKLGLPQTSDSPAALISALLSLMQAARLDYTQTFVDIATTNTTQISEPLQAWHRKWLAYISEKGLSLETVFATMAKANPRIIPRNLHVQRALDAATEAGDYAPLHQLVAALRNPYTVTSESRVYQDPGPDHPYYTFCGT